MELIPRLFVVGLVLACLANAINNGIVDRPTIAPPPPWRGSGVLSYSSNAYETPSSSADSYSSLEPYSFSDTAYPVPSISSSTPHPQYSAIVSVRTTTWVLSRSTTITSIILETYYSTLTDVEAGTATVTTTSNECTTASGYASVYASGCSSSSASASASASSSSSSSSLSMVTMTWSPEVTAYPLPSTDEGRSPASTSGSTTTTTTTASSGNETPPVVTGGAASAPQAAELRTLGVVAALLAMLL
ncbi:hypothetical protein TGAMA5MH_00994 [Trichoderma gamsii]|uniref:Uncharacterized protein n=1 Tax=Trichoderma gamsii TaxID=398673 RepID=A0A2K0TQZ0_9HYPO|nr:hypothetical protein TGAMA5MH_00994 [Trichoderma gamsii]